MKNRVKWDTQAKYSFDGDVLITDPCYINFNRDFDAMERFCGEHGLISRTYYGDWGCEVVRTDSRAIGRNVRRGPKIGEFCADGGMVCVLDMKDVVEVDPNFPKWIEEHSWCACVIHGFKGDIKLVRKDRYEHFTDKQGVRHDYVDTELRVHGDGSCGTSKKFSFESIQTSL